MTIGHRTLTDRPFFSVVVPTYHDWEVLGRCLFGLEAQSYPSDLFEVIVVNNDPDDLPPSAILSNRRNARLMQEKRPGSYAARNAALALARGEILAFTDADCIPDPNWLSAAADFFARNAGIGRVGGAIRLSFSAEKLTPAEIYEKVFGFRQKKYVEELGMAATANMFARASVFAAIGPFREDLFSGGDAEWGLRANVAGYPIAYCPDAIVEHRARASISELTGKVRRIAGGKAVKNRTGRVRAHIWLLYSLLPPLGGVFACRKASVSYKHKCLAFGIRWYLRVVHGLERVRLAYRGKPRRT